MHRIAEGTAIITGRNSFSSHRNTWTPTEPGEYTLRLLAIDNQYGEGETRITVNVVERELPPAPSKPYVELGNSRSVLFGEESRLPGSGAMDFDQAPDPLTFMWTQIAGPRNIAFNSTERSPRVHFSEGGIYTFQLVASDGSNSAMDEIVIKAGEIARQRNASASSVKNSSHHPSRAVDSDGRSKWISQRDDRLPWVQLDLDDTYMLYRAEAYGDGLGYAQILASNDPSFSSYQVLAQQNETKRDKKRRFVTPIDDSRGYRYVRLMLDLDAQSSPEASVSTLSIFATRRTDGDVSTPENTAPVVNAGGEMQIRAGVQSVLSPMVTDETDLDLLDVTWVKVSGPGSVSFSDPHALRSQVSVDTAGSYVLELTVDDGEFSSSDRLEVNVVDGSNSPVGQPSGEISRDYWLDLRGPAVNDLTSAAAYPSSPSGTDRLLGLEAVNWNNAAQRQNWGNHYGQRIRGFLHAPTSGEYVFWLASDDQSELWIGTSPENKTRIINFTRWSNSRQWNKYPEQKSVPVHLTAGEPVYVEILHKESGGGDNLAVGWTKPGEDTSRPSEVVPGAVLSPFVEGVSSDSSMEIRSIEAESAFSVGKIDSLRKDEEFHDSCETNHR